MDVSKEHKADRHRRKEHLIAHEIQYRLQEIEKALNELSAKSQQSPEPGLMAWRRYLPLGSIATQGPRPLALKKRWLLGMALLVIVALLTMGRVVWSLDGLKNCFFSNCVLTAFFLTFSFA